MPAAPDFRLYHSNSLDVLAGLLAQELRAPAPGQPLLTPDIVLIPQVAMRRWLQAELAKAHGVAANLEFLTPGELVRRALDANVDGTGDDLDADALRWRLYAALGDATLMRAPAMAGLRQYLGGNGLADADPLKAWGLAGELAAVFEKYQAWRRDWLLEWETGANPRDPQALLWRHVGAGRRHRARRIDDYLARFTGDAAPLPAGLPSRLFAFATLNISPDVLRVVATQARVGTLHFYLPSPTQAYWGDLQTLGAQLRAGDEPSAWADENPLLRDWGVAGKDFMALLGGYEVVHPSGEIGSHADPIEGGGALGDSLLRRMQSDVHHRRGPPPAEPTADNPHVRLPGLREDDPSLQFHACHTRLRELQVLRDRLRALLDDDRFDPPLQPREIAVLAPDIDLYAPYLDAVFGGDGNGGRIPYAIADASPLQGEPLAAVFLRLLALPNSRFGLEELLDLLASPPLAEAAGLDETDFERLHGWLYAAGARWGLDAAHRARRDAPRDAAYTWQFALDRLLLGHASGDDDDIAGVAPWPELEGGALAALDKLIRLLRVLTRHEKLWADAAAPAQWSERLLKLLKELLPESPANNAGQRALERLRKGIVDFARQAERAGFDQPVPVDVVRAHFTRTLGDADTRAPLLTGGVSFARMVPMRLLPFRVICLLGMNDGEFPRRDPAAGLNRLTAELGTDKRRRGDRSTRDDDRFLFLQLFSSAQDVFYLSWLGADPRDGRAREASALVSELLAAAADHHTDPAQAGKDLVLRHPLQPFAVAAFGAGGDARHFSYCQAWHPAADRLSAARAPLPAWMPAAGAFDAVADDERELSLDALHRFLKAPAEQFLRQRLQLRLPDVDEALEDVEPLQTPGRGLQRHLLQRVVFEALLAGDTAEALQPRLRARGLLPSGPIGARALGEIIDEVAPYANAFAQWRGDAPAQILPLEVGIDGLRLHGRLRDSWPQGIARLRFGEPNGPSTLRHGLDWLLACAAGVAVPVVEFHERKGGGIGPYPRAAVSPDAAIDALRALLALRREGLQRPLPFAPYSSWALFDAGADIDKGVKAATGKWRGSERSFSESDNEALRLALRGRDPFGDRDSLREFARVSGLVFGAVTAATPGPIDIGDVAMPEIDDAEDAA